MRCRFSTQEQHALYQHVGADEKRLVSGRAARKTVTRVEVWSSRALRARMWRYNNKSVGE
jgi:hypothetical protein